MTEGPHQKAFDFLIGRSVNQLSVGLYEFQIVFDDEISISVLSDVKLDKPDTQNILIKADQPEQTKELVCLLGLTVIGCQMDGNESLTLQFSNAYSITLYASNEGVDSYVVWNKGNYIAT